MREKFPVYDVQKLSPQYEKVSDNIYTCFPLLPLTVYIRCTCPKQEIGMELFQTSGFICLQHQCIHFSG